MVWKWVECQTVGKLFIIFQLNLDHFNFVCADFTRAFVAINHLLWYVEVLITSQMYNKNASGYACSTNWTLRKGGLPQTIRINQSMNIFQVDYVRRIYVWYSKYWIDFGIIFRDEQSGQSQCKQQYRSIDIVRWK